MEHAWMKILRKGICVMAPMIAIWAHIWLRPMGFVDGEAPYYLWNKEQTTKTQDRYYETLILGDSVANAAYEPALLSDGTLNLALGGTTPVESYYILQEWLAGNPAPQTCYISFMDFHLEMEDCFWSRTIYSHRFPIGTDIRILRDAVRYGERSIAGEGWPMDLIAYELRLPQCYMVSLLNGGFNQRNAGNLSAQADIELHRGRYIAKGNGRYVPQEPTVYDEFQVAPLFDHYYRALIGLCQENGIKVRLVHLPLPEDAVFTSSYIADLNGYYGALLDAFPGIGFDWFRQYDADSFADGHHMDSHGALRFSREIKALHPEDFDGDITPRQMAAIDDIIKGEEQIAKLLQRAVLARHLVLIKDATGCLERICGDELEGDIRVLYQSGPDSQAGYPVVSYILGGDGHIFGDGGGMQHTRPGSDPEPMPGSAACQQILDEWCQEIPQQGMLEVIVTDGSGDGPVCDRSFRYVEEAFVAVR